MLYSEQAGMEEKEVKNAESSQVEETKSLQFRGRTCWRTRHQQGIGVQALHNREIPSIRIGKRFVIPRAAIRELLRHPAA
jgi:hypothetical protein